jgi:hypothetical protein
MGESKSGRATIVNTSLVIWHIKGALICTDVIRAFRAVVRLLPDEAGCFVGEN